MASMQVVPPKGPQVVPPNTTIASTIIITTSITSTIITTIICFLHYVIH